MALWSRRSNQTAADAADKVRKTAKESHDTLDMRAREAHLRINPTGCGNNQCQWCS